MRGSPRLRGDGVVDAADGVTGQPGETRAEGSAGLGAGLGPQHRQVVHERLEARLPQLRRPHHQRQLRAARHHDLQEVSSKGSRPCSVCTQYLNAKSVAPTSPSTVASRPAGAGQAVAGRERDRLRADRFVVKKKVDFQIYDNAAAGGCAKKSTWHVKLADLADAWSSSRIVTVASLHLPTGPANQHDTAPDCTYKNMRLVSAKVSAMNRDRGLMVMAGDWNHADPRTRFVHQHSTYAGWTQPYRRRCTPCGRPAPRVSGGTTPSTATAPPTPGRSTFGTAASAPQT